MSDTALPDYAVISTAAESLGMHASTLETFLRNAALAAEKGIPTQALTVPGAVSGYPAVQAIVAYLKKLDRIAAARKAEIDAVTDAYITRNATKPSRSSGWER